MEMKDDGIIRIMPQPGPQEQFLSSPADIIIYGGEAGGGKTWGLLMEPLRHVTNTPGYSATIFRATTTQITNPGGLWDASMEVYSLAGGEPTPYRHTWKWPGGGTVKMSFLEHDKDVFGWQGTELPCIMFDELTHFSSAMFWYMVSRNRSTCGVKPYIRATCNPDPDSWVSDFISWWIDEDGYAIPERSGVIRWFIRHNDVIVWGDSREELQGTYPGSLPKSFTFIKASLSDNQALMTKDPGYLANLQALPRVERERLLRGNWKIRPEAGSMFPASMVNYIPGIPFEDLDVVVRRWDLAATTPSEVYPDPDATAGVLIGRRKSNGRTVIMDLQWCRKDANDVRLLIKKTAEADKKMFKKLGVMILIPQDPGQAGKDQAKSLVAFLAGHKVITERETGDKETRAEPLSAQWNGGTVEIVAGPWNQRLISEMSSFPEGKHDDIPDAASGGFNAISGKASILRRFRALAA